MWKRSSSHILLHCWDDACVVYHPVTGETHQLTRSAGEMLKEIQHKPTTSGTLASQFHPDLSAEERDHMHSEIEATLHQIAQLGLIEKTPD